MENISYKFFFYIILNYVIKYVFNNKYLRLFFEENNCCFILSDLNFDQI